MTWEPELFTGLGAALAIFLTALGSAIASGHAGIFALKHNNWIYFVPVVQAGVLSVYRIIIGVLLCFKFEGEITASQGYRYFAAGLSVGLGCLASGHGMAVFIRQLNEGKGVAKVESPASGSQTEPLLPPAGDCTKDPHVRKLILVMIFLESIGLYGLIVSLFLVGK